MLKKLSVFFTVIILSVLMISPSYATTVTETNEVTESSEIRLTIDVSARYTDGFSEKDTSKSDQGKAVFIGITCLLLILGIVIIAVKSRNEEPPAPQADDVDISNN